MICKVTGIFESRVGDRPGGWSESFYRDSTSLQAALDAADTFFTQRMLLTHPGIKLDGIRVTAVDLPTVSLNRPRTTIGNALWTSDTPWQAWHFKANTADGKRRSVHLRGAPDSEIVNGSLALGSGIIFHMTEFGNAVGSGQWRLRTINGTSPTVTVSQILSTGQVTTVVNHNLNPDDMVSFPRTKYFLGGPVKGTYRVFSAPTPTTFTVLGWNSAQTVSSGFMRKKVVEYPVIDVCLYNRVTFRKPGRVFFQLRGRRQSRK